MPFEGSSKWFICRICLKGEHKKLYNIFEHIIHEELTDLGNLHDQIELCGGVKLYQQNNLPTKICNSCVLLLRAACKFRDLCQQAQNQLKQFINIQKQELDDEHENINFDSDAEDQKAEAQEEVESVMLTETQSIGDGYIDEEKVEEYDTTEDVQDEVPNSIDDEEYISTVVEQEEFEALSDGDGSQYVVEEVSAKQFVCVDNEEEITTFKYEDDVQRDNIIIEEHPGKPHVRRVYIKKNNDEKKPAAKRKRKNSDETDNGTISLVCLYCDNTYTDKSKFNMHLKIHKKEKPHQCEICQKRFSTTPQLSRHMNSHTGNRPYQCKYCEASFGDPSTKIKHERIHTNERPYKCNLCDKAFAYSNVLKVHMMTHTGEKPYSCDFCGKSFSQVHHKNAHERKHSTVANVIVANPTPEIDYLDETDEQLQDFKVE